MLERLFKLSERGTTVRRELLAGVTTFMTMAYIIFVNPFILKSAFVAEGTDFLIGNPDVSSAEVLGALTIATCIAAAAGTLIMAFSANLPVALAPGMGMNAIFATMAAAGLGWQKMLGVVFLSGLIFLVLSIVRFRETVMAAVPDSIKYGAAAGIGLFIGFIGLQHGGIVTGNPVTLVQLGDLTQGPALLALFGLVVTSILIVTKVPGAILLGLAWTGLVGLLGGVIEWPGLGGVFKFHSPAPVLFKLDIVGALSLSCVIPVLTFLFFDLFDTVGTLMGVGEEAGLMVDGRLPKAERALAADAGASIVGSFFGTSTVTSYVESAAGVAAGGRTGLANVATAALFLLAILATPLVAVVGGGVAGNRLPVTAPALIVVGYLMCGALKKIDWPEPTEALPAFLTVILMPATFSISTGLAAGFVSYSLLKIVTGRAREAHWIVHAVAWTFVAVYAGIKIGAVGGAG